MKKPYIFKHTDNKGFTLTEIMVVLSIVVILSGITLPNLLKMNSTPPEGEELELLRRTVMSARNKTVTSDVCAEIVLNTHEIKTTIYKDCGPPLAEAGLPTVVIFNKIAITDFNVGDSIVFQPGGGTNQTNPVRAEIVTDSEKKYELLIFPAIGTIRLKKLN